MVCEYWRGLGGGFAHTQFLGLAALDFQRGNEVREGRGVRRDLPGVHYTPGTANQNLCILVPDLKPSPCGAFGNHCSLWLPHHSRCEMTLGNILTWQTTKNRFWIQVHYLGMKFEVHVTRNIASREVVWGLFYSCVCGLTEKAFINRSFA